MISFIKSFTKLEAITNSKVLALSPYLDKILAIFRDAMPHDVFDVSQLK
jgi:hypothetical protein